MQPANYERHVDENWNQVRLSMRLLLKREKLSSFRMSSFRSGRREKVMGSIKKEKKRKERVFHRVTVLTKFNPYTVVSSCDSKTNTGMEKKVQLSTIYYLLILFSVSYLYCFRFFRSACSFYYSDFLA